jgi:nucleotide-binding universal stress UspA family protein
MDLTRILCPVDFSDASAHAVDHAAAIAGRYGARITALHVLSPVTPSREAMPLDRLRQETASFLEPARAAGIAVDVLVETGRAANHILDRAAQLPADLIVMGTHGSSGFEHLMLGSVTEKVLRKAICPVLTVPPRAQAPSKLPFERLLCAVDFSESSITALRYALSLAQEWAAELTVLHVLEWPWEEPPPPAWEELPFEQRAALAEYRRYCESSAMARLESLVPASERTPRRPATRVSHGKPYVQILHIAAEEQADLIVIGVRGRSPLGMTMFGSTANEIVRRATCPVLTLGRRT